MADRRLPQQPGARANPLTRPPKNAWIVGNGRSTSRTKPNHPGEDPEAPDMSASRCGHKARICAARSESPASTSVTRVRGQPGCLVSTNVAATSRSDQTSTDRPHVVHNTPSRPRTPEMGRAGSAEYADTSGHFWPSVQFESGGLSNNASSAASGAWKRVDHSSRWARRIGSLSQGGSEFRASMRRQSSSVGTSR